MALELWATLKHAITDYTGLSPALFFTVIALSLAFYYVVSGLFGSSSSHQNLRSMEEKMEPLPPPVQVGEISEEELKQCDGSDPTKPLLMAIKGQIYDVSQSRLCFSLLIASRVFWVFGIGSICVVCWGSGKVGTIYVQVALLHCCFSVILIIQNLWGLCASSWGHRWQAIDMSVIGCYDVYFVLFLGLIGCCDNLQFGGRILGFIFQFSWSFCGSRLKSRANRNLGTFCAFVGP